MKQKIEKEKKYLTEDKFEKRMKLSDANFDERMRASDDKFEKRMKQMQDHFDAQMKEWALNITNTLQKNFDTQMKWHANNISEDLTKKIINFKDQILTTVDPLLQELETRRQDREIASYQTQKINDTLDNHDIRITTLEHL